MKAGLYPKLAFDSIRKNKRMYLPFIFTCSGMVMMYYIMEFLAVGNAIDMVYGADIMREVLSLGGWVIAIFSAIFLFYTNSFLIKRRKKEFGLYNILGMGKRNIALILFWETLYIAVISVIAGLFAGIAVSKLAELGMVNMLHGKVQYDLSVSVQAVIQTAILFGIIFLLLLLNAIRQVRFSSAVSLLRSENVGEKPPKGNIFFGRVGVLLLIGAYFIAVRIKDPVAALFGFFVAVIMVIIGTYLVFISGSVVFCRLLRKNKSYYYKPNHFVSVSSMSYRMKRNGAGLASICILATMVLVMISSTACLYFGLESVLSKRFPREIDISFGLSDEKNFNDETLNELCTMIDETALENGIIPANTIKYKQAYISGMVAENRVILDVRELDEGFGIDYYSNLRTFYFIPLSDYNSQNGKNETLSDGEALMYDVNGDFKGDSISFDHGKTIKIKKRLNDIIAAMDSRTYVVPDIVLIVPDIFSATEGIDRLADYNGNRMISYRFEYYLDTNQNSQKQRELYDIVKNKVAPSKFDDIGFSEIGVTSLSIGFSAMERESFYSLFGTLFYLGIILSVVFITAAVLIIYYKQISEGYEDRSRFDIMRKVGMTKRDIRRTINSQLLTVFFLPLVFAAMHIAFAFPIIQKLLLAFGLDNIPLFAFTTIISVIVYAAFYTIVYKLTSNAYYNIVSGAREETS